MVDIDGLTMAVKRALVAMVLTVTAASDIFAQDLEDTATEASGDQAESQAAPEEKFHCAECKAEITKQVNDYSVKTFKKPLCFNHQKAAKNG